jgi:S-adenosylmethionine-diacylglycerol 3-amino-3-carboxypropyl transferase
MLFDLIAGRALVYNQCWEDPAVDREALGLTPADRVLVITSAGCNALDYALLGARVVAVDKNPCQNHLLELKLAGIRALDYDAFFALFGRGGSGAAREIYQALRPELGEEARRFWDRRVDLFQLGGFPGGSFYYRGTSGRVALALRLYLERVARLRAFLERMLAAERIEEQLEVYHAHVRRRLLGRGVLEVLESRGVLWLLGVPTPQREMVRTGAGGFAGFIAGCIDRVVARGLLRDNYFWRVYLTGSYTSECCPEYLKPHNFAALKGGLVDNVRVETGTVTERLSRPRSPFTAFILLDHMDWVAARPRVLEEEWRAIFAAAGPGARVIFRSGGPDARFLPPAVARRLEFDVARAAELHRRDRVGTYASFHIARIAA